MVRSLAALVLLPFASGLVPSFHATTRPTQVAPAAQGRREVMEQVAAVVGAAVLVPKEALADGAVSKATVERARGIYGAKIAGLKDAVAKGDFEAVADEKNAFTLFNSGAYAMKGATQKAQKAVAEAATKEIFAAIDSKDKAALAKAYDAYMKNAAINVAAVDAATGQGYQTEYDWKSRTAKGAIYQR